MNSSASNKPTHRLRHKRLTEMILFAILADLMLVSKLIMEALPNIHPLGLMIAVTTVVFRKKALIPIYLYVLLDGLIHGFGTWWIPYLYIWTILWGMLMLLPREMPKRIAPFAYAAVCGVYGLLFGILYAPAQALLFGLNFEQTLVWVAAGLPFDALHGASNFIVALPTPLLVGVVNKLMKRM